MSYYLAKACEKLNITPEQVLSHAVRDDEFVLVVDKGIAGCPKTRIPLSELGRFIIPAGFPDDGLFPAPVSPGSVVIQRADYTPPDTEATTSTYESMTVKTLKVYAKDVGITGYRTMKKSELIAALEAI
ncbi:MAG: hypothetical protein GY938_27080 [Ketobacter sp.]|nr:hypothetical protein [Ketobacter sp.]